LEILVVLLTEYLYPLFKHTTGIAYFGIMGALYLCIYVYIFSSMCNIIVR